jgi:flagellar motor protein MotB
MKGFAMTFARTASTLLLSAFSIIWGLGCVNKVHDENLAFRDQNRELQAQLSERDEKLKSAPDAAQLASMQKEIADRDARIRELQANLTHGSGGSGGATDPALAGIEATYDAKAGTLTVNLPGDVLFDAGQATLKPSALGTLDKVAAAIKKDYSGKAIRVDGYTDSDPITKTRNQWDDNWDLSYGRAKSVMTYLTAHGVNSHVVSIAANGSNKPKASKPSSRRVEIVVLTR